MLVDTSKSCFYSADGSISNYVPNLLDQYLEVCRLFSFFSHILDPYIHIQVYHLLHLISSSSPTNLSLRCPFFFSFPFIFSFSFPFSFSCSFSCSFSFSFSFYFSFSFSFPLHLLLLLVYLSLCTVVQPHPKLGVCHALSPGSLVVCASDTFHQPTGTFIHFCIIRLTNHYLQKRGSHRGYSKYMLTNPCCCDSYLLKTESSCQCFHLR